MDNNNNNNLHALETMETYLQRIRLNSLSESELSCDDDSDSDTDNDDLYKQTSSKFDIVIPELFVPSRYGYNKYLKTHIMVLYRFKYKNDNDEDEDGNKFFKNLEKLSSFYRHAMWRQYAKTIQCNQGKSKSLVIRNWSAIVQRPNYFEPQLAQCIRLDTGETVCIIKTFWLKIIQRTWKKVFKERQRMLKNISLRQRKGKVFMPSLKGMLMVYRV